MKLFLVNCGYYEREFFDGLFEMHVTVPVAAPTLEEAKLQVKNQPYFQKHKMHVDGIYELDRVDGHRIALNHEVPV